jgi:4-hydroxybenzoate polyprenyltransferase
MAVCLFALGLSLGAGLGSGLFAIAMAATLGLAAYDLVLRRVPLLGNLTVSGIGALALIYGGAAAGHAESALVPAGFAFLFHLGREILKDLEDVTGDAAAGAGSLALAWGPRRTLGLITAIYLLLAGLTPVPYWLELYGWPYLVLVLVPVDGILAYVLIAMWRDRSVRNLRFLDRLLKTGMVFGLVALWVGRK